MDKISETADRLIKYLHGRTEFYGGPNGLHAKYPEDCSPSELVKKYFPNVMARNVPVEEMNNETEPH